MEISYKAVEKRKLCEVKTGELFRYFDFIYMLIFSTTGDMMMTVNMKTGLASKVCEDMWDALVEVVEGTLILDCYE